MTTVFEKEALEEYRDAARYSQTRFALGHEFVEAVRESLGAISQSPTRFQLVRENIRVFRMRRFPFNLFYQYSPEHDSIIIYAVAHHARRPDYWRKRTSPLE